MNILPILYSLPEMSIYSFINDTDKKIYIGFAYDTLSALPRLVKEMKYRNNPCYQDFEKLEFKIIETINTRKDIRLRYQHWVEHYRNIGYTHYRNYKAIQYNLRIEPINDFRTRDHAMYLYCVKVVSRGRRERIIGIFDKVSELNRFVNHYYPNKKNIINIVHCDNSLTKQYREYING